MYICRLEFFPFPCRIAINFEIIGAPTSTSRMFPPGPVDCEVSFSSIPSGPARDLTGRTWIRQDSVPRSRYEQLVSSSSVRPAGKDGLDSARQCAAIQIRGGIAN